ncbi:MAG: KpsF/GutQ family sugar-phosphate isomerase [Nitrospinota bacterium]|mgnify:FL=1|jgi:arabinose-5-phosphate isomerase|nr:KpsF/GutQ family sugar-phosphate isomerase [Nitrospinota bacterium]MDP7580513.1 KpsF/GutQ family sugar-phosphate isomerase [Nitrospinota bacterium]HJN01897.1 KpsF/GutQ family sugar-phosphate isomerase [Nitrospinota bacterium]
MIIEKAKQVLKIESESIQALINRIDDTFVKAVNLLDKCKGRVVITGIGKSGIIGKKISATLASIGVPSIFLHAADGTHGDLGMITSNDIVIAISNSGESEEILNLLPAIKRFNVTLVSMTGNLNSTLAKKSNIVLNISVKEEACPLGLVPTASTTATMALGDALAMALLDKRGFKEEDFAVLHPSGSLGKKLLIQVDDLMHIGSNIPIINKDAPLKDVIMEISSKKLGMAIVVNQDDKVLGIITDGDLRRLMEKKEKDTFKTTAEEMMSTNPKTIEKNALAARALQIMEKHSITSLIITNGSKGPTGIIHLHDILKAGVV